MDSPGGQINPDASRQAAETAFGGGGGPRMPGHGRALRLVVIVLALAAVVIAALTAVHGGKSGSGSRSTVASAPPATVPTQRERRTPKRRVPVTPAAPARPPGPISEFDRTTFAATLAAARDLLGPRARISYLRLSSPEANLSARTGRLGKQLLIDGTDVRSVNVSTLSSPPDRSQEFTFARLDPAVPQRLIARIRRRYHVARARIDYMLVTVEPIDHRLIWLVYPRYSNRHFQANASGGAIQAYG